MSVEDGVLKMSFNYGGLVSYKRSKFSYSGGNTLRDVQIDPDLLTWSIFEDFMKEREPESKVEQVWYKLPTEDISVARSIFKDKDSEIRNLCEESKDVGEVDLYIKCVVDDGSEADVEDGVGERGDDEEEIDNENREESDVEEENVNENREETEKEDAGEDENNILGFGTSNPRFATFFTLPEDAMPPRVDPITGCEPGSDSESEEDRPFESGEYPDSPIETDEEWANFHKMKEKNRRKKRNGYYDYDKAPYLWLMQTFHSGDEFKDQLLKYVLKTQFDVKLNRWESTKLAAVCSHPDCEWRIYCSVERPIRKWMVKVYVDKHNHLPTGRAKMLKQGTIAKLFKEEARRRPEIRSSDIKDDLMHIYGISVSIFKCRKARRLALDIVLETQRQQFAKLWDYEAELLRSNPGTTNEIGTVLKDKKKVFDRFYVCFEPLRQTWKKCCRPLIGLDGAFLEWELKGEILAAVGRDGDNKIYPIAWAVVMVENTETWEWFVSKLKADQQLGEGDGVAFISDKQKGLVNALTNVIPKAEHRVCA